MRRDLFLRMVCIVYFSPRYVWASGRYWYEDGTPVKPVGASRR